MSFLSCFTNHFHLLTVFASRVSPGFLLSTLPITAAKNKNTSAKKISSPCNLFAILYINTKTHTHINGILLSQCFPFFQDFTLLFNTLKYLCLVLMMTKSSKKPLLVQQKVLSSGGLQYKTLYHIVHSKFPKVCTTSGSNTLGYVYTLRVSWHGEFLQYFSRSFVNVGIDNLNPHSK